ncbi:MAG: hypothetical protein CVT88_00345 [Candidatus Altiarchaeales archaeon HGW-Altiarchaeales-1]|nr:MAG: hypothetical protein CVT88_00345 [Candidatus Altiarchaeales archaeon HGW-Altiarchaeales-1]
MNEQISEIILSVVLQIVFAGLIVGMVLLMIYYYDKREKWIKSMNDSERKKWEQYQKYKKSQGGGLKGIIFVFSFIAVIVLGAVFLDIKIIMLFLAIIYTLFFLIHVRFVLKTRNKDGVILIIGIIFMLIWIVSFLFEKHSGDALFMSIGMLLLMYGNSGVKAEKRNMNLHHNLVVTSGCEIDSHLDGYSQRPFSMESNAIKEIFRDDKNTLKLNFMKISENFAKTMGKDLIFMDWKVSENEALFYPVVFPMSQIYLMFHSLRKNKLSWIKINNEGRITVFVSKDDYKKILEQVTYHALCRNIAEKFERAFIEFAKGSKDNKFNAIKILRGEK